MTEINEVNEANAWWNKSPDDFKIAVWKMFFMADVIGYNPNNRTAVTIDDKNAWPRQHSRML